MDALGDWDLLETLAPSYLVHHWNADRMAALAQWTAETTL